MKIKQIVIIPIVGLLNTTGHLTFCNAGHNQPVIGCSGDDVALMEILHSTRFTSAKQTIESLSTEVEAHRQGAEPNDDLTMMCLQIS